MSLPPKSITFKSDANIIEFRDTLKPNGKGEIQYIYEYVKSESKLNTFLGLNEKELRKIMENNSVA